MKYALPALLVSFLVATGCQQQPKQAAAESSALDITPAAAPTPVAYSSPAPMQTMSPDPALATAPVAPGAAASSASGGSYTVKKGDTLWSIAATRYGSGQKWHEIADANPGLSPQSLRVGQTITLP